jgi:hypothetical protein
MFLTLCTPNILPLDATPCPFYLNLNASDIDFEASVSVTAGVVSTVLILAAFVVIAAVTVGIVANRAHRGAKTKKGPPGITTPRTIIVTTPPDTTVTPPDTNPCSVATTANNAYSMSPETERSTSPLVDPDRFYATVKVASKEKREKDELTYNSAYNQGRESKYITMNPDHARVSPAHVVAPETNTTPVTISPDYYSDLELITNRATTPRASPARAVTPQMDTIPITSSPVYYSDPDLRYIDGRDVTPTDPDNDIYEPVEGGHTVP